MSCGELYNTLLVWPRFYFSVIVHNFTFLLGLGFSLYVIGLTVLLTPLSSFWPFTCWLLLKLDGPLGTTVPHLEISCHPGLTVGHMDTDLKYSNTDGPPSRTVLKTGWRTDCSLQGYFRLKKHQAYVTSVLEVRTPRPRCKGAGFFWGAFGL